MNTGGIKKSSCDYILESVFSSESAPNLSSPWLYQSNGISGEVDSSVSTKIIVTSGDDDFGDSPLHRNIGYG